MPSSFEYRTASTNEACFTEKKILSKGKHIGVKTETMKKEEKKKGSNKEFGNK